LELLLGEVPQVTQTYCDFAEFATQINDRFAHVLNRCRSVWTRTNILQYFRGHLAQLETTLTTLMIINSVQPFLAAAGASFISKNHVPEMFGHVVSSLRPP
jgi:hypothetical protein